MKEMAAAKMGHLVAWVEYNGADIALLLLVVWSFGLWSLDGVLQRLEKALEDLELIFPPDLSRRCHGLNDKGVSLMKDARRDRVVRLEMERDANVTWMNLWMRYLSWFEKDEIRSEPKELFC